MKFKLNSGVASGENNALAILDEGEHYVSGGEDKCVKVWDYDEGIQYYNGVVVTGKNEKGESEALDGLQLEEAGVNAIGDAVKGKILAQKAEEEGTAAVKHILGEGGHVNYDCIPGVIYTYPEVANAGKSEEELKAAGIPYNKEKFPFAAKNKLFFLQRKTFQLVKNNSPCD